MSDDLIEKLNFCAKIHPQIGYPENGKLFAEAAARIEALQAERDDAENRLAVQIAKRKDAEAKRDAAVLAERRDCCATVYGYSSSFNEAQRIVDAIRARSNKDPGQ